MTMDDSAAGASTDGGCVKVMQRVFRTVRAKYQRVVLEADFAVGLPVEEGPSGRPRFLRVDELGMEEMKAYMDTIYYLLVGTEAVSEKDDNEVLTALFMVMTYAAGDTVPGLEEFVESDDEFVVRTCAYARRVLREVNGDGQLNAVFSVLWDGVEKVGIRQAGLDELIEVREFVLEL